MLRALPSMAVALGVFLLSAQYANAGEETFRITRVGVWADNADEILYVVVDGTISTDPGCAGPQTMFKVRLNTQAGNANTIRSLVVSALPSGKTATFRVDETQCLYDSPTFTILWLNAD